MAIAGKAGTKASQVIRNFGAAIKNIVEDKVEDAVEKKVKATTKKTPAKKATTKKTTEKKKAGRQRKKRGPKPKKETETKTSKKTKSKKKKVYSSKGQERIASLKRVKDRKKRAEIGSLLRQSEFERRGEEFAAPPERGGRTSTIDPVTGQSLEGGVNTRLRSKHIPDYQQQYTEAVAHLRKEYPGKSDRWYAINARKLIERDFPKRERGEEVISGPPSAIQRYMSNKEGPIAKEDIIGITNQKRGGTVRRRAGGPIGVGAALRGYGKGYKK